MSVAARAGGRARRPAPGRERIFRAPHVMGRAEAAPSVLAEAAPSALAGQSMAKIS